MTDTERDTVLQCLYEAFGMIAKPTPMTSYKGSHCDEEVDAFNRLDWEEVTLSDYVSAMEGVIICPPATKVYLLPRLFKMVMLRRASDVDDPVDNVSMELEAWPVDPEVERVLTDLQKKAVVAAWSYLDRCHYYPSGSHVARELAAHWGLDKA
ncbi:hypothetical protein GQ651_15230 [Alphaproteobacteria bacterium GH1-50]|uniref:Uncharacterized protein n=1 Tax=Kangsaoukella pontilimi TaxID=2691042 RepID=A0A7C9N286_9RHOB|nr:hypothetical protein [Kangsaoukella pontilimi]MXQ09198.1 hypothetical protein [Kangsaoukella pontilimi]